MQLVALGIRRQANSKTLDVYFPQVRVLEEAPACLKDIAKAGETVEISSSQNLDPSELSSIEAKLLEQELSSDWNYSNSQLVLCTGSEISSPVSSADEAYLRLQAVSQKLLKPNEPSFEGLFGNLNNIAWTNYGPIHAEDLEEQRIALWGKTPALKVSHLDKFPYLLDYHIPKGVRVVDGARARLGAHLSEGTTIMPAGYVNFNAGTLGAAMIEGRVSGGVVVGDGSDIGGGASTMGTLSGGNTTRISLGEKCLLGANAGTGIPLGDGCTVEAGLYITAGSPVALYNENGDAVNFEGQPCSEGENFVKARELSGRKGLLFFRDSATGQLKARPNKRFIEINAALHSND